MENINENSFFVRNLVEEDIREAVNLHIKCFPDNFLTHLGYKFLFVYYQEFVENEGNYGLLVCKNKRIVGTLVGSSNSYNEFYSKFYQKNFFKIILSTLIKIVTNKYVRNNFYQKKKHLIRACKSLCRKNKKFSDIKNRENEQVADLQSIYIDSQFRGCGCAKLLIDSFCAKLYSDGIKNVALSVENDNQRAISFYKKCGWKEMERKEQATVFYKNMN